MLGFIMEDPAENFATGLSTSDKGECRNVKNGSLRLKGDEVFLGTVDSRSIEFVENDRFLNEIEDAGKCIDETQDGGTRDALPEPNNMAGYNVVPHFFMSPSEFVVATYGHGDSARDNARDINVKKVDEWLKESKSDVSCPPDDVSTEKDAQTEIMVLGQGFAQVDKPLEGDPATVTIKEGTGEHLELLIKTRTGEQVFRIKSNITLDGLQPLMLQQVLSEQIVNGGPSTFTSKDAQSEQVASEESAAEEESSLKCEESAVLYESIREALGRNKSKIFPCPVEECSQVFNRECKLKIHLMSHEETRPFKCEECDWSFTSFYRLKRHLVTHIGRKDYACGEPGCSGRFTTVYNLNTHREIHKRQNAFPCRTPGCDRKFSSQRKMELHLKDHSEIEAPYKCPLATCGKSYYSANFLASHLRVHQYNLDDLKCPVAGCGKCFTRLCQIKQHLRMHTGERPYACDHPGCGWTFSSASKLTRHTRKHTGDRRYVCPEAGCGKSFMRPEHLKGHVVIHTGVRPFLCPHPSCKLNFTAKSSLYVHLKKHKGEMQKTVYPCPINSCIKKYTCKSSLRHHLLKAHASELGGEGVTLQPGQDSDEIESMENGTQTLQPGQDSDDIESMEDGMQDATIVSVMTNGESFVGLPGATVMSSELLLQDSTFTTAHLLTSTGTVSGDLLTQQLASMSTAHLIVTPDLFVSPVTFDGVLPESRDSILSHQELDAIPQALPDSTGGSARTDYCSNLILSSRAKRRRLLQQQFKMKQDALDSSRKQELSSMGEGGVLSSADVVLSSAIALPEPSLDNQFTHNQLLQDDPPTSDIYHEDHLLNTDLPVPLLVESSVNVSVNEFTGSTINLQDLE